MEQAHCHITLDLQAAADFLKMSTEEVRSRAARGLIPAAKPGKQWVFIEEDLASYLRSLYAYGRRAAPSREQEATICSGNVVTLGGLTLHHRTGSALDAALAQRTKRKPRNSTTASKRKPGGK
ncbi:helix-turn-helix domain-containing protein [Acidithiobacillus ferrivorans]